MSIPSFALGPSETGADIDRLAERLGTTIPPGIDGRAWALPILLAMMERIEALERAQGAPLAQPPQDGV
jgi:hypothetical protein